MGKTVIGMVCLARMNGKGREEEHILADRLLIHAAKAFFGVEFDIGAVQRTAHGKPYYTKDARICFNISHCREFAAATVSYVPVGVDIESGRSVKEHIVRKCCSVNEISYVFAGKAGTKDKKRSLSEAETRRFLRLWTLKESYVKMTGEGMRMPFDRVCFDLNDKNMPEERKAGEVAGSFSDCRHFLYLDKNLTAALSVQCQRVGRKPEFIWKFLDLSENGESQTSSLRFDKSCEKL